MMRMCISEGFASGIVQYGMIMCKRRNAKESQRKKQLDEEKREGKEDFEVGERPSKIDGRIESWIVS